MSKTIVVIKDGFVHGVFDEVGNRVDFDVYDETHEKHDNFQQVVSLREKLGTDNRVLLRKLGVRPNVKCDKFMLEVGYEVEGNLANLPELGKSLFVITDNNRYLRTSPVTKITDDHDDIIIETENSIYLIEKRGV